MRKRNIAIILVIIFIILAFFFFVDGEFFISKAAVYS